MERRTNTPAKFRFPSFQIVHWLAARHHVHELEAIRSARDLSSRQTLTDMKKLIEALKIWLKEPEDSNNTHQVLLAQFQIDRQQLLKELCKEVKRIENLIDTSAAELKSFHSSSSPLSSTSGRRESKRRRHKKVDDDFIDTSSDLFYAATADAMGNKKRRSQQEESRARIYRRILTKY